MSRAGIIISMLVPIVFACASCNDNTSGYHKRTSDSTDVSGPGRATDQTEMADSITRAKGGQSSAADTVTPGNVNNNGSGANQQSK